MILVDSSVWIDHFNGISSPEDEVLTRILRRRGLPILVGDIIMYEVLCGFRSARHSSEVQNWLEKLLLVSLLNFDLVPRAVRYYQLLRRRGVTVGAVDMIIGTYCIEHGVELLTGDRDFEPMRDHLGLRLVA